MLQQIFDLGAIVLADLVLSIDNALALALALALAVAAIADGNTRLPAISWLGLGVLLYVAGDMFYRGPVDPGTGLQAIPGAGLS